MSQEMDDVLRKSLKEVDRSQKWQVAGLIIFLLLLALHVFGFIVEVHEHAGTPSRRDLFMGTLSVMFTVCFCAFGVTFYVSRMVKRVLKAIELSSRP
jgi:threonine/homoserine/homoserine lactone efflux protein